MTIEKLHRVLYVSMDGETVKFTQSPTGKTLEHDFATYHDAQAMLHQKAEHDWGVATGLEVRQLGENKLRVRPGVAIDRVGRLIALSDDDAGDDKSPGKTVTTEAKNSPRSYVVIRYAVRESDEPVEADATWKRELLVEPEVELMSKEKIGEQQGAVVLAVVDVDKNGKITALEPSQAADPLARKLVGVPAGEIRLRRSEVGDAGKTISDSVVVTIRPTAQGHGVAIDGDLEVAAGKRLTIGTNALVVSADGKVGIGKGPDPKTALDVVGTVKATKFIGAGSELTGLVKESGGTMTGSLSITAGSLAVQAPDDLEFPNIATFHSKDKVQGLGIGHNRIHAIGTFADQPIWLVPKGSGSVVVQGKANATALTVTGNASVTGKLTITGGAITPAAGNSEAAGIMWPRDPFGGSGDAAWIRYHNQRGGEKGTLEIGITDGADDHVVFKATGNVGIGADDPTEKLDVVGTVKATKFIGAGSELTGLVKESGGTMTGSLSITAGSLAVQAPDDLEFPNIATFHSKDKVQGLGIGHNRIHAIGTFADQPIWLVPKGTGAVAVQGKADATAFTVTGNATFSGTLTVTGALTIDVPAIDPTPTGAPFGKRALAISGRHYLEFGAGVANKESYAGRIGYKYWTDGLDIIGAGDKADVSDRKITLHAQGGLTVVGPITEKLDVIDCNNSNKWHDANHPIQKHFRDRLFTQPVGTVIRAMANLPEWYNHIFIGIVSTKGVLVTYWQNGDLELWDQGGGGGGSW